MALKSTVMSVLSIGAAYSVIVDRLPGWAAYPARHTSYRMFTLQPGQIGRYRANLRFTGCACAPRWCYESWTVHIAFTPPRPDLFLSGVADRDVDQRVHLYGGSARRAALHRAS
ncbi:hypothetical protein [Micromonospora sp. KC213]|uniref:hypothetical protein n=1 Tax=Micromonospora sp. KC213 TaxID=2530378 RepID=UPI0010458C9D|nr:hypothetical protein [Micromonospora sp. KC213]TDC43027.1 hypothetical protein E1166_05690 [Micromonospora sp. KC213]